MRLRIFLGACVVMVFYLWLRSDQRPVEAPPPPEALASANPALLRDHPDLMPEQFAILLLRQEAEALPAARALEAAGVPFTVTGFLDQAFKHRVIFLPSADRPVRLTDTTRGLFKSFVDGGGVLILEAPSGSPWTWITGVESAAAGRGRKALSFRADGNPELARLSAPQLRSIRLAGAKTAEGAWTYGLKPLAELGAEAIADFETGEAAVVRRRIGAGAVYTLGLGLRDAVVRGQAERHFDAERAPYNAFEPAADAWPLFLRGIYERSAPFWARLRSEPGEGPLWLMTHSIGPGARPAQIADINAVETARKARSTWFVETRTGEDAGNAPFYDNKMRALLAEVARAGFEVASHGVSHASNFAALPVGGGEQAKDYRPTTDEDEVSENATLRGETAVSKQLLDAAVFPAVDGFRSPAFAYPTGLDAALKDAGYRYDSSLSAAQTLTHFPFRLLSARALVNESPIVELPITFEDQVLEGKPPPVPSMLETAKLIAAYGGAVVWDIRPDGQAAQLERIRAILDGAPKGTRWLTMRDAARFWSRRSNARFSFSSAGGGARVLRVRSKDGVGGLSFELSGTPKACSSKARVSCRGRLVLIDPAETAGEAEIRFRLD
jgi:hypothetical protein